MYCIKLYEYIKKHWIGFIISFVIGFLAGPVPALIFFKSSVDAYLDVFLLAFAIIALSIIAIVSYQRRRFSGGWGNSWTPVALIAAIVAILILGVNYNIKKKMIPIEKISAGGCEICFSAKTQETMRAFCCPADQKKYINEILQSKFGNNYECSLKCVEKRTGDLLKLCCSESADKFIEELNCINACNLENLIKKLSDPKNKCSNDIVTQKVIEMLLFDAIGLQAFKDTIETSQTCKSNCSQEKPQVYHVISVCPNCASQSKEQH